MEKPLLKPLIDLRLCLRRESPGKALAQHLHAKLPKPECRAKSLCDEAVRTSV
ncbi:MAG: hypothetical protein IT306_25455 [Chloroflexi bacterium]|nr:hypothetical protein [Chloroflexota bacterium]